MKKLRVMVMRDSASGKKAAEVIRGTNGNGMLGNMMMMDTSHGMSVNRGYGGRSNSKDGNRGTGSNLKFIVLRIIIIIDHLISS